MPRKLSSMKRKRERSYGEARVNVDFTPPKSLSEKTLAVAASLLAGISKSPPREGPSSTKYETNEDDDEEIAL